MSQPLAPSRMTYVECRARETAAPSKHEYLRGEVFAMAGGSPEHARLQSRMAIELGRLLAGRPCEPFSSDLRVRVYAERGPGEMLRLESLDIDLAVDAVYATRLGAA